jgi:hypothetical protein
MKQSGILMLLALLWAGSASAACNNPKNWLESPAQGVKTFVGYKQELEYGFATQMTGDLPGQAVHPDLPYPPPLPAEMLEKAWQGKLSEKGESFISYYEPDGKGNWRVCRVDKWAPKNEDFSTTWLATSNQENQRNNPIVRPWLKSHFTWSGRAYLYDSKGRLSEVFLIQPPEKKDEDITGDRECFRFDAKDRPEMYVRTTSSNACPKGDKPDPHDFSERFRYLELKDGWVTFRWGEQHFGKPDGSWVKEISFRSMYDPNNKDENRRFQGGNARADSTKGVTQILGGYRLGEKDESLGPSYKVNDHVQPSEYYFTKPPVPISMLDTPEEIYNYDRRRETSVTKVTKLLEFFPARQNRVRDRFYTIVGNTVRHEQYDAAGKLKRVINVGQYSRQDKSWGFYDEDLKSAKLPLKLKGHPLFYRVWEYDAAGKGSLVALGWNEKFTLGKSEPLDSANIVYGTPDGTKKWANQEDFFKAFDFDATASRAYGE